MLLESKLNGLTVLYLTLILQSSINKCYLKYLGEVNIKQNMETLHIFYVFNYNQRFQLKRWIQTMFNIKNKISVFHSRRKDFR